PSSPVAKAEPAEVQTDLPAPSASPVLAERLAPKHQASVSVLANCSGWERRESPPTRRREVQRSSSKSMKLLQKFLHDFDFCPLRVIYIRREIEDLRVLSRTGTAKQILDHDQRTTVMLNHPRQKQPIKLGPSRLFQSFHLLWSQHPRHGGHRAARRIHIRHARHLPRTGLLHR